MIYDYLEKKVWKGEKRLQVHRFPKCEGKTLGQPKTVCLDSRALLQTYTYYILYNAELTTA